MESKYTNHLIHETSPYLLQHAHNPVDWYPWGEEALEKAKSENKLLLVSIGYAACHWCHVMEHESFEDSTVAARMNASFVCIKVDREERPDIDQIYMDAVMLMTGSGGWPLNCIALPDGRPIWGGTYFPKENWLDALDQLADFYRRDSAKAVEYAVRISEGLNSMDAIIPEANPAPFTRIDVDSMVLPWLPKFDPVEGGPMRSRNKFPMPNNYLFLQRVLHHTHNPEIEKVLDLTLQKMARGGIYDQLGGGFARYSTDPYWIVPHFEKMLYDNGQLVSLYAEAWLRNPDPLYKRTVFQTLEWVEREMTSPEGGFYSSLDADSEKEEGKFYVWTEKELRKFMPGDLEWYMDYYNCKSTGNWEEGKNILYATESRAEFARQNGWTLEEFERKLNGINEVLLEVRGRRVRPGLDDKILASWNALMLRGYVDAYRAFGEKKFLETALTNANFIAEKMKNGDGLYRNYKEGRATINAFLDDYALVADAFLELYQVTGDPQWLEKADSLTSYAIEHFYSKEHKMFWYTSDLDPALISRKFEMNDNVIPGSNSVMANNLYTLSILLEKQEYADMALQMLATVKPQMPSYPGGFSNWGILLLKQTYPWYEWVITGPKALEYAQELESGGYLPNKLVVPAVKEGPKTLPLLEQRFVAGETMVYVCQNKVCKLPVKTIREAVEQIK
ncbi:MAG: thioredoxin domain-containing protein [Bacteroidia bacterium]|nr:thioredoxin domain-containing protein [Bacteroidia bacterium]